MHVTFRGADYGALTDLWNRVAPSDFAIDEAVLRLNLEGCPVFDWGASAIAVEDGWPIGFCAIKRSSSRLYRGPDADVAHVSLLAFREAQVGVDLLAFAKRLLRERGVYRLEFGRDSQHFFPGCPDSWSMLYDFLTIEGFEEGGQAFDLTADLRDYVPRCEVVPDVRRIRGSDVAELIEFLRREFPGRWAYDTAMKLEREATPDFVYCLRLDGAIEGFAVTQDVESQVRIGGAVFKRALGPDWCALGPIGISRGLRGEGWGDKLLATALADLKERGKRMCRIDWTTLTDWYGMHGFEPERGYRAMTLTLEDGPTI